MSSNWNDISEGGGNSSTRKIFLPDEQAEPSRLGLGALREFSQTQRTSSVRRGNGIFRVTEGCGDKVEEVWVRVITSAGKLLFSIFKRAREKQSLGPGLHTMPGLLPTAGE